MKQKLNIAIMGQNCEKVIKMCLESVKTADNIVYCDGGSTDNTLNFIHNLNPNISCIMNAFDQEDKQMNGKQRNFYLGYLKKHHMGEWCLVIDADEVVADLSKIRFLIDNITPLTEDYLFSVKMRHFIGSLGKEDAVNQEHFVPNRLFKIREDLKYTKGEHSVLWTTKNNKLLSEKEMRYICQTFKATTIWHLAYCSGLWDIRKKYLNHLAKSEMHSKDFLEDWYSAHLFGKYPTTEVEPTDIPHIILKEFLIDPDKLYFANRRELEPKHYMLSKQWINYFNAKSILDLGCGLGLYGYAIDSYGVEYQGMELSKWAVEHNLFKHLKIKQGDITEKQDFKDFELVMCVDVLEHINEEDLDKTLDNVKSYGKNFLFSIPWIGNPHLDLDPTHKIKKSKDWWVDKLSKNFRVRDAPNELAFHEQMLIGELKND